MKNYFKKVFCGLMVLIMCFTLAACGQENNEVDKVSESTPVETGEPEKQDIKVGCVPITEPCVAFLKEALATLGYNVEIVMFDANNLPATALKDGDIDGILANHLPWINTFNKENNCELTMIEPYYYYSPYAIYSVKHDSIEKLPEGAQIVVPNDPANMERSLLMLQDLNLIKLGEKKDTFYSVIDITENVKGIEIIEAEMTMTARNIKDVDAVFAVATVAQQAGADPTKYLYMDPGSQNYPIGIVVNSKNTNAEWATEGAKLIRTEKMKTKFNEHFKGSFVLFD